MGRWLRSYEGAGAAMASECDDDGSMSDVGGEGGGPSERGVDITNLKRARAGDSHGWFDSGGIYYN